MDSDILNVISDAAIKHDYLSDRLLTEYVDRSARSVAEFKEQMLRNVVARLSGFVETQDQLKWCGEHQLKILVFGTCDLPRTEVISIDGKFCGQFEYLNDYSVDFYPHGHIDPEIAKYL